MRLGGRLHLKVERQRVSIPLRKVPAEGLMEVCRRVHVFEHSLELGSELIPAIREDQRGNIHES